MSQIKSKVKNWLISHIHNYDRVQKQEAYESVITSIERQCLNIQLRPEFSNFVLDFFENLKEQKLIVKSTTKMHSHPRAVALEQLGLAIQYWLLTISVQSKRDGVLSSQKDYEKLVFIPLLDLKKRILNASLGEIHTKYMPTTRMVQQMMMMAYQDLLISDYKTSLVTEPHVMNLCMVALEEQTEVVNENGQYFYFETIKQLLREPQTVENTEKTYFKSAE